MCELRVPASEQVLWSRRKIRQVKKRSDHQHHAVEGRREEQTCHDTTSHRAHVAGESDSLRQRQAHHEGYYLTHFIMNVTTLYNLRRGVSSASALR